MKSDFDRNEELLIKTMQENAKRVMEEYKAAGQQLPEDTDSAEAEHGVDTSPKGIDPYDAYHTEDLLKQKKGKQNLKHRKKLLNRLLSLFAIQMVCMNIIVAFVIFASYVKLSWLRDMSDTTLNTLTQFMTFYITAVLAELLAAIVDIVKKVFSE